MGNRKKTRREKEEKFLARIKGSGLFKPGSKIEQRVITVPTAERVVLKKVPAIIHWNQVDPSRTDSEIVGEQVIFEDGTSDIILNDDLSDDARRLLSVGVEAFSLDPDRPKEG